jgi:hypothetical protein
MNLERIERALREGPVDEPRYVPGAFGPARRFGALVLTAAVGAALVIGVAIGLGLDLLRAPSPGVGQPPPDLGELQAELAGTWISAPVTEDEYVDFMLEQGHARADVEAFLDHDPIESTLQWGLDFDGRDNLVVFSVTGDGVTDILANGPYELLPDGRLRWVDRTCVLVAEFSVSADRLTFGDLALEGCVADERIAHDTFFNLASPYTSSVR